MFEKLNSPRTGGLLALILAVLILPLFFQNTFHYDVAIHVAISATVAISLNLLVGYAGQISLGHAGFFGVGAYSSAILTGWDFGWSPITAMLVASLAVGVLALVVSGPILRLKGHYLAMATLGLGIIIAIVITTEDWLTGGPDGLSVEPLTIFGLSPQGEAQWYWVFGVVLIASVWLSLNLIDSPVGRAMRAVHGSEVAAQVAGVDTTYFKTLIFVMSAMFASLMGSLSAHYSGFVTPDIAGFHHSIELITMVVLGGMASVFGAITGAVILTLLPQMLTGLEDWEMVIFGLILMLTMIFMPKGLVPTLLTKFRRGAA